MPRVKRKTAEKKTREAAAPIIGHGGVLAYFDKAIAREALAHAYLLTGPEQVGKTTLAKAFAGKLLANNEPAKHPDFRLVERGRDAKTGKPHAEIVIDQVHELRGWLSRGAFLGGAKVAVISGAHLLNREAANALLKNLEEPNPGTYLLLTAPSADSVLPTIASRCQTLVVARVPEAELTAGLEARGSSPARARLLARLSGGRPGAALELSDDRAFAEYDERRRTMLALAGKSAAERWSALERMVPERLTFNESAEKTAAVLDLMAELARDAMIVVFGRREGLTHADLFPEIEAWAARCGRKGAAELLESISRARGMLAENVGHRAALGLVASAFK